MVGLNRGITVLAEALAAEVYVVLAPDGYRGSVSSRLWRALWLRLTIPAEQVRAHLHVAFEHLSRLQGVAAQRIATMVCFGGWPVKFVAGDWDNEADESVIESVTLTYDFFELIQ